MSEGDHAIKIVLTTYPASDKGSGILRVGILSVTCAIRGPEISHMRTLRDGRITYVHKRVIVTHYEHTIRAYSFYHPF